MLRLIIIVVLALLTIPHIQSQNTETSEAAEEITTALSPLITITGDWLPTLPAATSEIVPPTTTQTTTATTTQPIRPLFSCNFNTPCFGNGQLTITNGSEFNSPDLTDTSEPPRAPTSDVTSITQPTSNNGICKLPYRPLVNNGAANASWDMWFCNNNECPTASLGTGTCVPGFYGLVSLDPSQSSETIIDSLSPNIAPRDSVGDQCLRFHYYFTVYNNTDWRQRIQLWIRPNNETNKEFLIRTLTVTEMVDNKWNFVNITFNSEISNYTLVFRFEVGIENRTEDAELNKTVYFALDNIELYDYNCSYVNNPVTIPPPTQTQTTPPFITQSPSTNSTGLPPVTESTDNLPLILGLSLGIGVPVLIAVIGGLIYYFKVYKPRQKIIPKNDTTNTTTAAITDIPMAPIKTTGDNSTIAAVVV